MQTLSIAKTESTPKVLFDINTHTHYIEGESYPENTNIFYQPIFDWLCEYLKNTPNEQKISFNIDLVYFNSSSSKVLMDMFDLLEDFGENGKCIEINWLYNEEDESSQEYGEEFAEDYEIIKFNLIKK